MVAGADEAAVEAAMADLMRAGAKPVSKSEPLGRNGTVTREQTTPAIEDGGCKVIEDRHSDCGHGPALGKSAGAPASLGAKSRASSQAYLLPL